MISIRLGRDRDFGLPTQQHYDQGVYEETVPTALRRMVMAELRFGANVTQLSPTEIHLVTRVLGDRDTTVITGSEQEMRPLVQALQHYTQHCQRTGRLVVVTGLLDMLERLPHGTAADRGFQQLVMPFVTVENGLQYCLLAPLGITGDDLQVGLSMSLDDVETALQLMEQFGTSFHQVLETTGCLSAA